MSDWRNDPDRIERIATQVVEEHVMTERGAGDGYISPREAWIACTCGVTVWGWQEYYFDTDEDPGRAKALHLAAMGAQAMLRATSGSNPTREEQNAPTVNASGLECQKDAPTEIVTGEEQRCCAHRKCPGGSLCCCQDSHSDRDGAAVNDLPYPGIPPANTGINKPRDGAAVNDRAYGHDETEDFETLAEAERREDGSVEFRVVQLDKRAGSDSTEGTIES